MRYHAVHMAEIEGPLKPQPKGIRMARKRKQRKQSKPQLRLRMFETTEASEALAADERAREMPRFFIDSIVGAYGADDAERIVSGIYAAPSRPITFRANTINTTRESVAEALEAAGISWQSVDWYDDAFVISEKDEQALWQLDLIAKGYIYLQSLSSMMPPLVLAAHPKEDILDMCAAPGGKTTQLAALAPKAHITACEMSVPRAEKLHHNLFKQGAVNVQVMRCDARELDEFFSFDRILLDAPCTGSGTLIAGNERTFKGFTPELLQKCARSQRALLDRALGAVKPGGTVLYSTCSVLPQENEDAVTEALDKHPDCEVVALDATAPETIEMAGSDEPQANPILSNPLVQAARAGALPLLENGLPGTLTLAPTRDFEGFYICLIKKKGSTKRV